MLLPRDYTGPPTNNLSLILGLPESVLSKIGLIPPPKGVTPNFINPHSIGYILVVVSCIGIGIIMMCTAIRLCVMLRLNRPFKWAWSDITFAFSIALILGMIVVGILSVVGKWGPFGRHSWDISLPMVLNSHSLTILAVYSPFSIFGLGLIKVTIFLTYIELFSAISWIKISCYVGIALTSIFYAVMGSLFCYWSFPHGHQSIVQYYVSLGDQNKKSNVTQAASIPVASVGLAIDIYLFIVPLIAVSKLHMTLRKKIGVASIFGAGILAIVMSSLSIYYRNILLKTLDNEAGFVPLYSIFVAEVSIGVIIACTPHIAKFVRTHKKVFSKLGSIVEFWLCCCCISFRELNTRQSLRMGSGSKSGSSQTRSKTSSKGSKASKASKSSKSTKASEKSRKLYPGLDLSTVAGTVGAGAGATVNETIGESVVGNTNADVEKGLWQAENESIAAYQREIDLNSADERAGRNVT